MSEMTPDEQKPPQAGGLHGETTGLPVGRVSGLPAFQQLVRETVSLAAQRQWSQFIICDTNYEAWPLAELQLVADFRQWSRPGAGLTMLAHHFEWVQARQARFVEWRKMYSHLIKCGSIATSDRAPIQTYIWTPEWAFELQDAEGLVGIGSENARFRTEVAAKLNFLKSRSRPGFPVSVLGL